MSTRDKALRWLIQKEVEYDEFHSSKYYDGKNIWFLTFPIKYCENTSGSLKILLQKQHDLDDFYCLDVPFTFFYDNCAKLDVRNMGDKFDLHISGRSSTWLECERSNDLSFVRFLLEV